MTVKLVLKPTSEETDLKLIASLKGWQLLRENPAEPAIPHQILWTTPDGATTIIYVEDQLLQTRYLTISGPEEQAIAKQLEAGLEAYSLDDLSRLSSPDLAPPEAVVLVNAAALKAPQEYDAELFELISKALQHPAVEVRRAAVFAITYVPWRQFRNVLSQLGNTDPALARDVQVVIDTIDDEGWIYGS